MEGCGTNDFVVDPDMMGLIFATVDHTNRFVRETSFYTLGAIVHSCCQQGTVGYA